jgi:hypothetical protein
VLRYDRRAITVLGQGERVGRLAGGVGGDAEIQQLGRLWEEEGVFTIHNDLTNCLRHGDLTAVRYDNGGLDVQLIEVKASRAPGGSLQLKRLERATRLLQERRVPAEDGGSPIRVDVVPGPYRTFLTDLAPLIRAARWRGHAWFRPTPCLLVGAVDYRVWGDRADEMSARSVALRTRIGWPPEQPDALGWTASVRRLRDRRESFSSLAPLTIYPLPAEDVADLVMGFLDLSLSLRLDLLEGALNRSGPVIAVARPPDSQTRFLEASLGRVGVIVPPHLREQLMMELMTPASVARAIDYVLEINARVPGASRESSVVAFENEGRVWDSRGA